MSLPSPSTTSSPNFSNMDPKQLQQLEAPMIALTQLCQGDLRQLMFAFFSFLHRRTDFYVLAADESKMGFRQGDAEKLLLASFRQFPLRRMPSTTTTKQQQKQSASADGGVTGKETKTDTAAATINSTTTTTNRTDKKDGNETSPTPAEATQTSSKKSSVDDDGNDGKKKNEQNDVVRINDENGLQIPVGNGGSTPRYKWTQTIDETSVLIGIPKGLRGKDLDVQIKTSTLTVRTKTKDKNEAMAFVEGDLVHKVRPSESTWSIEGGVVIVTLEKLEKRFWKTVLQGDDEIDTELVDNRRRIDEYDDSTQAQIRKIVFDQEQYHKGQPTSDEILKKEPAGTGMSSTIPPPAGDDDNKKPSIPPLPPGVEYIDQQTLDEADRETKQAALATDKSSPGPSS